VIKENRKSVIGRDRLKGTQRGNTASQRADLGQLVDCMPASGLKAQDPFDRWARPDVVLLPTFPTLRADESHYREKTKSPKLLE
jgi:hypothetical protein